MSTPTGMLKSTKEKLAKAEAENKVLRDRLNLSEPLNLDAWEAGTPQALRDEFAARAIFMCWGDLPRAAIMLGFAQMYRNDPAWPDHERRIFKTPGVEAILSRDLNDATQSRVDIIRRQRQIALHGSDDASVRAVGQLAKIDGWITEPVAAAPVVNLYQLFGAQLGEGGSLTDQRPEVDTIEATDPMEILSYEPSDIGIRIDSGDDEVKAALQGSVE